MRVTAHFEEGDKGRLLTSLSNMAKDNDFDPAFRKIGQTIRFEVEGRIPKDTRELVESWGYEQQSNSLAEFGFNAVHSAYQHEGGDKTRKIVNRPAGGESKFLANSIEAKKNDLQNIVGHFVKTIIYKNSK
jgi:hypothetical protein